jgi:hypothetical protein
VLFKRFDQLIAVRGLVCQQRQQDDLQILCGELPAGMQSVPARTPVSTAMPVMAAWSMVTPRTLMPPAVTVLWLGVMIPASVPVMFSLEVVVMSSSHGVLPLLLLSGWLRNCLFHRFISYDISYDISEASERQGDRENS